ncbi:MAG: hypothetical protein AVDCRST_MAG93-2796 [uncultured Chloroflexia bacterium]|uniref:Uncharacterized protein n=1 Tax=uncultured Chloroflexia bacterium TaxID=1672391 RepID=A0A6J4JEQ8_9CHLR|nr:MAG: hypothetical protein AVDCRST_MAG93-2796 [uncultured Chloroflexia bacterium]
MLREKAQRFAQDKEIQAVLSELRAEDTAYAGPSTATYSADSMNALKQHSFDLPAMSSRGRRYEELDQLVVELLLGVR